MRLSVFFSQKANSPDCKVEFHIDELLDVLGIKRKQNNHLNEAREGVAEQLKHLSNFVFRIEEDFSGNYDNQVGLETRLIKYERRKSNDNYYTYYLELGTLAKIFIIKDKYLTKFDDRVYTLSTEFKKAVAYYVLTNWKDSQTNYYYKVSQLLRFAPQDKCSPQKKKDLLEDALIEMVEKGLIKAFDLTFAEPDDKKYKWLNDWFNSYVHIKKPDKRLTENSNARLLLTDNNN